MTRAVPGILTLPSADWKAFVLFDDLRVSAIAGSFVDLLQRHHDRPGELLHHLPVQLG